MRYINIYSHLINSFILLYSKWLICRLISSKIGRFVHIQPNTWKFDLVIESFQLIFPKIRSSRVKVIYKMNLSWPDLTSVVFTYLSRIMQKDIKLFSTLHSNRVSCCYSHINQRYEMYSMTRHHFVQWIFTMSIFVYCKNHLVLHVV